MDKKKAVVILSGGMDSTTLLYDVISQGYETYALSFDYGQKHKKELLMAAKTCAKLGIDHKIVDLDVLNQLAPSALTREEWEVPEGKYDDEVMKQTVVPNRNMVLLSLATSYAIGIGAVKLFYGAHAGDHCIPEEELVLTDKGKVTMGELQVGDKVLSFSKDNKLRFNKVLKKVDNGYREDIYEVSTSRGDIKATSNHKFFKVIRTGFNQTEGYSRDLEKIPLINLQLKDGLFTPYAGLDKELIMKDNEVKRIDLLPYCDISNDRLKYDDEFIWFHRDNKVKRYVDSKSLISLLAWYITEGSRSYNSKFKGSNSYGVCVAQSEEKNLKNYKEILDVTESWGFTPCKGREDIAFSGPTTNIFRLCGDGSHNKKIPEEFIWMHPELLLKTLWKGDGHRENDSYEGMEYSTVSPVLKEQVMMLSTYLGYSTSSAIDNNTGCHQIYSRVMTKKYRVHGEGIESPIKSVKKVQGCRVFDIEVERDNNFFCGKGAGFLVSNSIYPDCRKGFIDSMKQSISLCDWTVVDLEAPYWEFDKGDIAIRGKELNVDYSLTWTCYKGREKACGKCGACVERLEAFEKAGVKDSVEYE